jgi:MFS family permease
LPLTTVTRRFPSRVVMAAGYLLIGAGFSLNAIAHSVFGLVAGVVIFTFGEMAAMPVSTAYVAELSPAHLRGRYMGAYALTWSAALICAPQLGLRIFGVAPSALWLTCGALGVLAAAIIVPLNCVGRDEMNEAIAPSRARGQREKEARMLGDVNSK